MRDAFKLSEKVKLPVIVRITTRLAHSRAIVERMEAVAQNELNPETDKRKWILCVYSNSCFIYYGSYITRNVHDVSICSMAYNCIQQFKFIDTLNSSFSRCKV